jgi:hypothetical protein
MKRFMQIILIMILVVSSTVVVQGKQLDSPPSQTTPPRKVFLPAMAKVGWHAITGQVTDDQAQPLAGVAIADQYGHTVLTDQNGNYTLGGLNAGSYDLAPSKPGYVFSPSVVQVDLTSLVGSQNFSGYIACTEAMLNGGFETDTAWVSNANAGYASNLAHTGSRSMRTGIVAGANTEGHSRSMQSITIPALTPGATLRLWLYPLSGDTVSQGLIEQPNLPVIDTVEASNDSQYVNVLDENGQLLETLLMMRSNDQAWGLYQFNLSKYAGQTVRVQAGVYNDGLGGVTALYIDDVSLELCDMALTLPEEPTQNCVNRISNNGFEFNGSWVIPGTEYPAAYSTRFNHTTGGTRSMRTGIIYTTADTYSYSDAYQQVHIPEGTESITLNMWLYQVTEEPTTQEIAVPMSGKLRLAPLANDLQYILVMDTSGNILQWLLRQKTNSNGWKLVTFNLDPNRYEDMTIRIQFGTFNDGFDDVTTMYVDDVTMDVCVEEAPVPTPTEPPVPTPPPGACPERISNNSFETDQSWLIPITAFSAGYSTANPHTGTRSMRNGIIRTRHNRYSYSDAYQIVGIPDTGGDATLSMYIYPISEAATDQDVQYVLVLDRYGNWIGTLLWGRSDQEVWTYNEFNMNRYRGTTIRLQFGVYNNGLNDTTAMYVDDVSLQVCSSTPTQ